jgi:hypothetical protein
MILSSLITWRVVEGCMEGCMRDYILRYFPQVPASYAIGYNVLPPFLWHALLGGFHISH